MSSHRLYRIFATEPHTFDIYLVSLESRLVSCTLTDVVSQVPDTLICRQSIIVLSVHDTSIVEHNIDSFRPLGIDGID